MEICHWIFPKLPKGEKSNCSFCSITGMEEVSISHINSDKWVVISWVEKTLEADFNSGFSPSALLLLLLSRHQSCPTLCNPIDGSPPGFPVSGILQERKLEWVAISFSNAWKWKGKVKSFSRVWLSATPWTAAPQAPLPMGVSRQQYWRGSPVPSLSPSALGPAFYAGLLSLLYLVEWPYAGISPIAKTKALGEKSVQKIL